MPIATTSSAADQRDELAPAQQRREQTRGTVVRGRDDQEGEAEAERVGDQQGAALERGLAGRGEGQDPAEDHADARRPADGEDRAEPE